MKKKILLIYLLLGMTSIAFSRIDCEIEGKGDVASIEVSFDDEDCKTKDFEYTHTYHDGTVVTGISTEDDAPFGEVDFGAFDCCEHA
ncbi:MAG: hypothetical protein P1U56_08275 [Saprospiraceae bacterium]|nr:hypothetical protein [Saprospiraceae bacterium]